MTVHSADLVARLRDLVLIAVIRAPDANSARGGAAALVDGGVRAVEITYSTPGADGVIAALRAEYGDEVVVGAGTLTTVEQVELSVAAGAAFLVSPGVEPSVATAMQRSGVPFALGALTPSEVMAALSFGPDFVKLFPGSFGGPDYLRALRGPFPDVAIMPTGGVSLDNARQWLAAGAVCLGVGGDLVSSSLLASGDYASITARGEAFTAALQDAR